MLEKGTGVEECKKRCNALPFGKGENHCSCIVVRNSGPEEGQCYLRDGVDEDGCKIEQCKDTRKGKRDVYIRGSFILQF